MIQIVPQKSFQGGTTATISRITPEITGGAVHKAKPKPKIYNPIALNRILEMVSESVKRGEVPILLFDLDDTLLSTRNRRLRVINNFIAQEEIRLAYPKEVAKIIEASDEFNFGYSYHIKDTMRSIGITNEKFIKDISVFFDERFFDNKYLLADKPLYGAVRYIKEAVKRGAKVIYFTGRWEEMRPGTLANLKKNGFPLSQESENVLLVMKPDKNMKDSEFKEAKINEFKKMGKVIGGFENEPKNANIFKEHFPDATIILVDTIHSGAKDPQTGTPIEPVEEIQLVSSLVPYRDDSELLKSWKEEPLSPNDPAFKARASSSFVPKSKPDSPEQKGKFTIATWNIENLFLEEPQKKPENELKAMAETLKEIDADIVMLQEVDNLETINEFQRKYMQDNPYPYTLLIEGNDQKRGIDVAIMSRYPIIKAYTYRDISFPKSGDTKPNSFNRDLLEAVIQITPPYPTSQYKITPEYKIRVFTTHLKSKLGGKDADIERESEAKAIYRVLEEHQKAEPDQPFILGGDLNDFPRSKPLKSLKEARFLSDLLKLENQEDYPTHHDEKHGDSRLDYLFASPSLAQHYIPGSARVVHTGKTQEASDHCPIVASFNLPT